MKAEILPEALASPHLRTAPTDRWKTAKDCPYGTPLAPTFFVDRRVEKNLYLLKKQKHHEKIIQNFLIFHGFNSRIGHSFGHGGHILY